MRPLTEEEIDYLSDNDLPSMSRIPIIYCAHDEGRHFYDTSYRYENVGRDHPWIDEMFIMVRERLDPEKHEAAIVFCDDLDIPISIITFDLGECKSLKERRTKNEPFPITFRDLSYISLMSASTAHYVFINHPEQKMEKGLLKPSFPLYEDEKCFFHLWGGMYNHMSDIYTFNLKDDKTSILNPPEVAKKMKPENYYSNGEHRWKDLKNSPAEKKVVEIYEKSSGDGRQLDLNAEFDASLGDLLPGMNETHMDRFNFYLSRTQTVPLTYDKWKRGEIPFKVEDLIDPASLDPSIREKERNNAHINREILESEGNKVYKPERMSFDKNTYDIRYNPEAASSYKDITD